MKNPDKTKNQKNSENAGILVSQPSEASEILSCAEIWLEASIAGHDFIVQEFWREHFFDMWDKYLPASDLFLAKKDSLILGFCAVHGDTLAALFILPEWWGKGIGSLLLHHVQGIYPKLRLSVYVKNIRAHRFYLKYGFLPLQEQICSHTGEAELLMLWNH